PEARTTGPWGTLLGVRHARSLPLAGDMVLDVLQLDRPALAVYAEGLLAAAGRQLVETRLDHREQRAVGRFCKLELDQRGGLAGVVDLRVDRVRMPAQREQLLGL